MQYVELESTVYFPAGTNNTSGSGDDGASAVFDVRECGAAGNAAPVLSGSATLLTHASYPAGCYEIAVAATAANGFAADKTYAVYFTLAVDSQNPTGVVGSFRTAGVPVEAAVFTRFDTLDTTAGAIFNDTSTLTGDVAAVKVVTDAIGATGTGLTAIPWNAAWDAEVQSEAADAITAAGLATAAAVDALPTNAELATALGTADDATLAQIALVKAKTDLIPAAPAAVGDIPTAAQNAAAWGASVVGNSRTRDYFLQGGTNKIAFDVPGAGSVTLYQTDDSTPLKVSTYTTAAGDPVVTLDPA